MKDSTLPNKPIKLDRGHLFATAKGIAVFGLMNLVFNFKAFEKCFSEIGALGILLIGLGLGCMALLALGCNYLWCLGLQQLADQRGLRARRQLGGETSEGRWRRRGQRCRAGVQRLRQCLRI